MHTSELPSQISILVRLHAILSTLNPAGAGDGIRLELAMDTTISDVVRFLELPNMEMVYSLNSKMVGSETVLQAGDELDIIPAISGGLAQQISPPAYPGD
jgi:sulfur carrier protein ThiS